MTLKSVKINYERFKRMIRIVEALMCGDYVLELHTLVFVLIVLSLPRMGITSAAIWISSSLLQFSIIGREKNTYFNNNAKDATPFANYSGKSWIRKLSLCFLLASTCCSRKANWKWATIDFKSEPVVRLKFRFPYLQIQAFSVNKTHFNAKILIF